MGDIIPLKNEPTRLVWMCGDCGCSNWYIYNDNTMECSHCDRVSINEECDWAFPPARDDPPTAKKIHIDNSDQYDLNLERTIRAADTESIVIVLCADGMIHTYNGVTSAETSRRWLFGQIREAIRMIKAMLP